MAVRSELHGRPITWDPQDKLWRDDEMGTVVDRTASAVFAVDAMADELEKRLKILEGHSLTEGAGIPIMPLHELRALWMDVGMLFERMRAELRRLAERQHDA